MKLLLFKSKSMIRNMLMGNSLKLNCATMVNKIRKGKDVIKVPVGNMLMCSGVSVFLSKTEVNDIHLQKSQIWNGYICIGDDQKISKKRNRKSTNYTNTWFARLPKPMRKLSGLISRCKNDLEWTNSTRFICNQFQIETF